MVGGVILRMGQFGGCVIVGRGSVYLLIKDARSFEHRVW